MVEEQRNYGFALRLNRKLDYREKALLFKKGCKSPAGSHVYLALETPDGKTAAFHFAPRADKIANCIFGDRLYLTAPLLPIHGVAYSKSYLQDDPVHFADELYFPITAKEYDALNVDLSASNSRFYHLLLHNCSTWSKNIAQKNGFDIPSGIIVTPESIGRALKELSAEQKRDQALLDAMGECDFAAEYSPDQRDAPLKPRGHVHRLLDRLRESRYR